MFGFKKIGKRRLGHWLLIILIIVSSFALGAIFRGLLNNSQVSNKQENHEQGFKYISPLLECLNASAVDNRGLRIKAEIESLIEKEIENENITFASVYVRDLNNGPWVGINADEKFSPASLMKVPLLISYLKYAENNPGVFKEKITINQDDGQIFTQNIIPAKHVDLDQTYTVEDLLDYMMNDSDNIATNALVRSIDQGFLSRIYFDLDINVPDTNQENYMDVRDYASFFRILYNATYLNHEMSEKALGLMVKSDFNNGIVAGVPAGVEVSHKFGERIFNGVNQLHDCGIVYRKNSNYLICIMTRGTDFSRMETSIKDISALVYKDF